MKAELDLRGCRVAANVREGFLRDAEELPFDSGGQRPRGVCDHVDANARLRGERT